MAASTGQPYQPRTRMDSLLDRYMDKLKLPAEKRQAFRDAYYRDRQDGMVDPTLRGIEQFAANMDLAAGALNKLPEDARKLTGALISDKMVELAERSFGTSEKKSTGGIDQDFIRELQNNKMMIKMLADDGDSSEIKELKEEIRTMRETQEKQRVEDLKKNIEELKDEMRKLSEGGTGALKGGLADVFAAKTKESLDTINTINAIVGRPQIKTLTELGASGQQAPINYESPEVIHYFKSKGWTIKEPMTPEEMFQRMDAWRKDFEAKSTKAFQDALIEKEEQMKTKFSHTQMLIKTAVSGLTGVFRAVAGSHGGLEQGLQTMENLFNSGMQDAAANNMQPTVHQPAPMVVAPRAPTPTPSNARPTTLMDMAPSSPDEMLVSSLVS